MAKAVAALLIAAVGFTGVGVIASAPAQAQRCELAAGQFCTPRNPDRAKPFTGKKAPNKGKTRPRSAAAPIR